MLFISIWIVKAWRAIMAIFAWYSQTWTFLNEQCAWREETNQCCLIKSNFGACTYRWRKYNLRPRNFLNSSSGLLKHTEHFPLNFCDTSYLIIKFLILMNRGCNKIKDSLSIAQYKGTLKQRRFVRKLGWEHDMSERSTYTAFNLSYFRSLREET